MGTSEPRTKGPNSQFHGGWELPRSKTTWLPCCFLKGMCHLLSHTDTSQGHKCLQPHWECWVSPVQSLNVGISLNKIMGMATALTGLPVHHHSLPDAQTHHELVTICPLDLLSSLPPPFSICPAQDLFQMSQPLWSVSHKYHSDSSTQPFLFWPLPPDYSLDDWVDLLAAPWFSYLSNAVLKASIFCTVFCRSKSPHIWYNDYWKTILTDDLFTK